MTDCESASVTVQKHVSFSVVFQIDSENIEVIREAKETKRAKMKQKGSPPQLNKQQNIFMKKLGGGPLSCAKCGTEFGHIVTLLCFWKYGKQLKWRVIAHNKLKHRARSYILYLLGVVVQHLAY